MILLFSVASKNITPSKLGLLGTEKCTYGPSYWCANFENARKCNVSIHD
jgi:saposin